MPIFNFVTRIHFPIYFHLSNHSGSNLGSEEDTLIVICTMLYSLVIEGKLGARLSHVRRSSVPFGGYNFRDWGYGSVKLFENRDENEPTSP